MMKSREELPEMLLRVYEYRSQSWNINTTEDLEKLAIESEREVFFYLIYAFIKNKDLNNILRQDSIILRQTVDILVKQADEMGYGFLRDYLSQFMVVNESSEQAFKVLNEIKMAEEREKRQYEG